MSVAAVMRVLELSADIASVYVCEHVNSDGKCRPNYSNFIIVSRSRRAHVPADVLSLYAYQATSLCIEQFEAEFHNITPPSGMYLQSTSEHTWWHNNNAVSNK